MNLRPDESILIGGTHFENGKVYKDLTYQRIEYLISNWLIKIDSKESGWITIYKDPHDGRIWELSYPNSELHGGGNPTLKLIKNI